MLGLSDQYPIPIAVKFYVAKSNRCSYAFLYFPNTNLVTIQLKYISLTCNRELPATIYIQTFQLLSNDNIRHCRDPSYAPVQIWDMKELEQIEILGKSLVAPPHIASLKKL